MEFKKKSIASVCNGKRTSTIQHTPFRSQNDSAKAIRIVTTQNGPLNAPPKTFHINSATDKCNERHHGQGRSHRIKDFYSLLLWFAATSFNSSYCGLLDYSYTNRCELRSLIPYQREMRSIRSVRAMMGHDGIALNYIVLNARPTHRHHSVTRKTGVSVERQ